jgi:U6 snRNA-associated Sm-like protein LSm1
VLQSTVERIFAPPAFDDKTHGSSPSSAGLYADVHHGVFLVRGENVMLLGEIDLDKDDDPPPGYQAADVEVVKKLAAERKAREKDVVKSKNKKLSALGFEGENIGDILL